MTMALPHWATVAIKLTGHAQTNLPTDDGGRRLGKDGCTVWGNSNETKYTFDTVSTVAFSTISHKPTFSDL